jgi:FAD binding domain/Berberine and berberine like
MRTQLNRREFLKLAAIAGASASLGIFDFTRTAISASSTVIKETDLRNFADGLHGSLVLPADRDYESARHIWNARFDRRPGFIVRCADAADVKHSVDFARGVGLVVAVRGGGHSFAGYSTCDDGLVIDLSKMKDLRIDVARREVRVQPGLVFSEIDAATQKVELAMVTGGCGSVGVSGFTLGGGEGSLSTKYGLGCDNLLSADVVLADGRFVTASLHENSDLFWALRGGGGNFGIVTSFLFRAYPVTTILAGHLLYNLKQTPDILRAYSDFAPTASDDLNAGFSFSRDKTGPVFSLDVEYFGDATSAEPLLRKLRSFGKPVTDTIRAISYIEYKNGSSGPPPGFSSTARTGFLPQLKDDVIEAITAIGANVPPGAVFDLYHMHGAITRVPLEETAFPLRRPGFDSFVAAGWTAPEQRDSVVRWAQSYWDAIRPYANGAYTNMLEDEGQERVKEAYGEQYRRLSIIKKKYDSQNFFHLNPNIIPAL